MHPKGKRKAPTKEQKKKKTGFPAPTYLFPPSHSVNMSTVIHGYSTSLGAYVKGYQKLLIVTSRSFQVSAYLPPAHLPAFWCEIPQMWSAVKYVVGEWESIMQYRLLIDTRIIIYIRPWSALSGLKQ